MEASVDTEAAKEFHEQLPRMLDDDSDGFTDTTSKLSRQSNLVDGKDDWYDLISEYGIMHFVHPDEPLQLLNNLKNNVDSESIDYKFPENVIDYVSLHDPTITADQLAVNYLLHEMSFETADQMVKSMANVKTDMVKLNRFNGVRNSLWRLLVKKFGCIQEMADNFGLITNQEVEYGKQAELMKSLIDDKQTRISELDKTKTHYIKLINELYFHMLNVKSTLKQVDFPVDEPKPNTNDVKLTSSDTQDRPSDGTPNDEFSKFIDELRSTMYQVDKKIRRCLMVIQEDFTPEKMNFALALYVYQNQERIQNVFLKKKMDQENFLKRQVDSEKPKIANTIMTRNEMKKRADQIVKYFAEKDTDQSKNRRKPISFRKSFI